MPPLKPELVGPVVGELRVWVPGPASGPRSPSTSTCESESLLHPAIVVKPANTTASQNGFLMPPESSMTLPLAARGVDSRLPCAAAGAGWG